MPSALKQVMLAHDEVMECHMVAGGFDCLLKVRVTDMESYRRFLGIASPRCAGAQTHTYFVMEVKSTHRLIVPGAPSRRTPAPGARQKYSSSRRAS
jgi:Lrp/AsnC family leucine-responsive transcriptional regulator